MPDVPVAGRNPAALARMLQREFEQQAHGQPDVQRRLSSIGLQYAQVATCNVVLGAKSLADYYCLLIHLSPLSLPAC